MSCFRVFGPSGAQNRPKIGFFKFYQKLNHEIFLILASANFVVKI